MPLIATGSLAGKDSSTASSSPPVHCDLLGVAGEESAEGTLRFRQGNPVLQPFGPGNRRFDGREVQFEPLRKDRFVVRVVPESLLLGIRFDEADLRFRPSREPQITQRSLVDREDRGRGTVFGTHVPQRGAGRQRHIRHAEYGSGSSRDWAAKGTMLLGVKAVLAQSYERIHRSNLIGMGVLPLQFLPGESAESWGLTAEEKFTITGLEGADVLPGEVLVRVDADDGRSRDFTATMRIDTPAEESYFRHGGILPYVLRQLLEQS